MCGCGQSNARSTPNQQASKPLTVEDITKHVANHLNTAQNVEQSIQKAMIAQKKYYGPAR